MSKMPRLFIALLLLGAIFACQPKSKSSQEVENSTSTEFQVEDGTTCYLFSEGQDSTFLTLTIAGNTVTGRMEWVPWEKDGARGDLTGKLEGNKVTADWNYTIEGSEQAEEKVFIIEKDAVGEMTGELTEVAGGKLVLKDPADAKIGSYLTKVPCRMRNDQ